MENGREIIIENDKLELSLTPIRKGCCKGKLWGGNLSSLVSILSEEKYLPDKDIILFLEDLNEPLYKIDKMLYGIFRCKKLKEKINGLIFGDFYMEDKEINPLLIEYSNLFNVVL